MTNTSNQANHQTTEPLKVVNPDQIRRTIRPVSTESVLGPRVLELTGILQTTLEIEQLIALFTTEARKSVDLDGLLYRNDVTLIEVRVGELNTLRATYDLTLNGQVLGALEICRDRPFTKTEIGTLENLMCALVYPLRNALAYRHAVEMASRDPLTGVQNRAALEQALIRETELGHRQDVPLSLIVFDIDHFKSCNDKHGHSFGDQVLKSIAQTASSTIRRCDMLFRFGGEEFVVIASHTDRAGAALLAERIRSAIAAIQTIGGQEVKVTVSLGVATLDGNETATELFDRSDKAMYQAKDSGRNCTELA
jgi:diguanylate cyclase (GGDEF)-like protein